MLFSRYAFSCVFFFLRFHLYRKNLAVCESVLFCLKYDCKCENIYAKRARTPRFVFSVALHAFLFYDAATCSENEKHLTRQSAELGGPPLALRSVRM